MADAGMLFAQTKYALLASSRNVRTIVFTIAFPAFLLVLFNGIFSSQANTHALGNTSIRIAAFFTAGLVAYAIMLQTFSALTVSVTTQREAGQLKRLRGTPMPPWTFIGAHVLRSVTLVVLMVVALFAIGAIFFSVHLRLETMPALITYVVLGTASFTTLGLAMTPFTPTVDAASAIGPFAAVILSFISGVFIPIWQLPRWLQAVGKALPLQPLADGLQRCVALRGTGFNGSDITRLLVWGAVGLFVAVRRFKWEPQAAGGA